MSDEALALLAVDPGPSECTWVSWDGGKVLAWATEPCLTVEQVVGAWPGPVAIETVECYGMPVGRDVIETAIWVGRLWGAASRGLASAALLIPRREVKLALCGSVRATDAHVRRRLMDLVGEPGTKRAPGPTYGLRGHAWAALAVAVVAAARVGLPQRIPLLT